MTSFVEQWLEGQRLRELTVSESVEKWDAKTKMKRKKPPRVPRGRRRRQSLFFPNEMANEIEADARRHARNFSQSIHAAWALSREKIMSYPEPL